MILLATLLATQLAPGCRRIEGAIRCVLAAPTRLVAPPPKPAADPPPPRRAHRPARHTPSPPGPKPRPASPPSPAEIAHHVDLLVAAADCTGARTLVAATESAAAADTLFHTCLGTATRPAPSGHDLHAVPAEAPPALGGTKTVDHPQ